MKQRNGIFLVACIVVLLALIFLEPSIGWRIQGWLGAKDTATQNDNPNLAAENEVLQAQLAELQSVSAQLPNASPDYIRAMVYSRYPFNFKNELLVNVGTDQGVAVGKAVVFQGILIGTVEDVYPDSALVQTVFDSGFKMAVRVGSGGYDALFAGGAYPMADSLEKNAPVQAQDIVYTAAPGLPYGLPVAIVESTSTSADDLFEQASLGFAYDVNSIQTVLIAQ